MGQDGEVRQGPDSQLARGPDPQSAGPDSEWIEGPYSELREAERLDYRRMLEADRRVEEKLWWKEAMTFAIAVAVVLVCAWLGGKL